MTIPYSFLVASAAAADLLVKTRFFEVT